MTRPVLQFEPESGERSLAAELDHWTSRWWRGRLSDRAWNLLAAVSSVLLLVFLLDRRFEPPLAVRMPLTFAFWILLVRSLLKIAREKKPDRASFVAGLCQDSGELSLLLSGAELARPSVWGGESETLRRAAVREAKELWGTRDPLALVHRRTGRRLARASAVFACAVALLAAVFPSESGRFARRWGAWEDVRYPRSSSARLIAPPESIVEGQSTRLRIEVAGPSVEQAWLWLHEIGETGFERRLPARRIGPNAFEVTLEDVTSDVEVAALAGDDDDLQPRHRLSVWPKPKLEEVEVLIRPPAYTGLEPTPGFAGEIVALPGSRLEVRARARGESLTASLVREPGDAIALTLAGGDRFEGAFTIEEPVRFRVRLRDERGAETLSAAEWSVRLATDHVPEARLDWGGYGQEVTATSRLSLAAIARDDFGLVELRLAVRAGERLQRGVVQVDGRIARQEIPWSDEEVRAGDVVELELLAVDGREPEPQISLPAKQTFRVVEPGVLLRRVLDALSELRARLDAALPAEVQARDASELERLAVTLEQNRLGGERFLRAIRSAAQWVERAARIQDAAERRDPIARAVETLAIVADWGEVTWRLQSLCDRQAEEVRQLRIARRDLAGGHRVDIDWTIRAALEREAAEEAARLSLALDHLAQRQAAEEILEAIVIWERGAPIEYLEAAAAAMERVALFEALEAASRALAALEACRERLVRAEEAALEGTLADPDAERGPKSQLDDLLSQLEEHQSELESGESLTDEELARLLQEIEQIQKELARKSEEAPAEQSADGEAEARDEEEAEEARDDARRALRNAKLARSLELQSEGLEATRRAMKRYLEALKRRFDQVDERDASKESLGQNLSGEFSAERLQPGSAEGLFPDRVSERARGHAERWGDRDRLSPIEIEPGSEQPPRSESLDVLRARYYRELAKQIRK